MRLKSVLFLLLMAVVHYPAAKAADVPPKGKPNEEGILVTAVWLDGAAARGAELFISQGREPSRLAPGNNRRSSPVPVKLMPGSPIALLSRPKAGKDGLPPSPPAPAAAVKPGVAPGGAQQPAYAPAGEIAWPKGSASRRILLLLAAGPGAPGSGPQVRGVALPDDFEAFPAHTIRVANFVPQSLFLRVGDKVENVPSGLSHPVPYAKFAPPGDKSVPLFPLALARVSKDGVSDVFFSTNGEGRAGTRLQLIVSPSPDPAKQPTVIRLQDSLPVEAVSGAPKPGAPKPVAR